MKRYKLTNSGESDVSSVLELTEEQSAFLRKVIRQLNAGKVTGHYTPYLYLGKGYTTKNNK